MAGLTFYTNPQSRGQIVRWMLEEIGEPYDTEILEYGSTMKAEPYLSINPMGKVPAIRHHGKVVTECAAICLYLADAFPQAGLAPDTSERADYYRWTFFASGPLEAAFSNKAMGWEPPPERRAMFGYGQYELAIDTLEKALTGRPFITGGRFTAADLYVASQVGFMLDFKLLEPRPAFTDYVAKHRERPAYGRAKQIDQELIEARQQTEASA